MSSPIKVLIWAEGPTDRAAARALVMCVGAEPGPEYAARLTSAPGKHRLDNKLNAYNAAGQFEPFLVLRDLDEDANCAPSLVQEKLPERSKFFCFRIVVRSIEAWLMADAVALAEWLQIKQDLVPVKPEELINPKQSMLALVRQSKSKELRGDLLPRERSGRETGPLYASRLQEFIGKSWNINRSVRAGKSPSLTKAVDCLRRVTTAYQEQLGI